MTEPLPYYNKRLLLLFLGSIIGIQLTFAQSKKEYIRAVAQKGDGIYILLGRYQLDKNQCALRKFCKLNALSETSGLKLGKAYKLPVYKYYYNQKSIRSTTGIKDWQQAKQIERYNDLMVELGLKASDFRRGTR